MPPTRGEALTGLEMEEENEYKRQLALFVRSSTEKGIELIKVGDGYRIHQDEILLAVRKPE